MPGELRPLRLCTRLFASITLLGVATAGVHAQDVQMTAAGEDMGGVRVDSGQYAATIDVHIGKSAVLTAPWPVSRVSIADPQTADVQVLSPRQVMLTGKEMGRTDLFMWGEEDQYWHARVNAIIDLSYVADELKKAFPEAELTVKQSQNLVIVGGLLRRAEHVAQLRSILDSFGIEYVDMTSLAGVQQVILQVKVAEVSRRALQTLGVNAFYAASNFFGGLTVGPEQGGALNPISIGVPAGSAIGNLPFSFIDDVGVGPAITLFGGIPGSDLEFFIQALAEDQYLRVLARPTLVAMSGEEANFLAGGEFPIPVVQAATAGSSSITVEYKEFGVRLMFRPTVLGDGAIRLTVAPEVSDLSSIGAVEIEGFQIPSLIARRAETTLELHSGQTFAMAGLLNDTVTGRSSRVPLLGDLPVLGALFRSVRYERRETELLVLVTASLAEPMNSGNGGQNLVPGVDAVDPSPWDFYMDGKLEGKTHWNLPPVGESWLDSSGLDRLKSYGGWSNHHSKSPKLPANNGG